MSVPQEIIDRLDTWANALAAPLLPLRAIPEGDDSIRLEFRQQIPRSVMIGKLIRAVSGLRGALVLAEAGYVAECAAVLRTVSDFCTEVSAIGFALHRGGEPPSAVRTFVAQYFTPRARTPQELASAERTRYVSREALMKAHRALVEGSSVDTHKLDLNHRFVNMAYDSYVHGAYESTMELWSQRSGHFEMRGHPSVQKREEFIEAVFLKMHEVVVAIELTAAVTAHGEVFRLAREARHTMDASEPWKFTHVDSSA